MSDIDFKVRRQLGRKAQQFKYTVGGREWKGWRAPAGQPEPDVEKPQKEFRAADVRLFLGDGGETQFALPGLPTLDVIEMARVGTHNRDRDDWREVRKLAEAVMSKAPFDVVFADQAGLAARFQKRPTRKVARAIADLIMPHDWLLDSMALMGEEAEEWIEDESDPPDVIAVYLVNAGQLRLWWD